MDKQDNKLPYLPAPPRPVPQPANPNRRQRKLQIKAIQAQIDEKTTLKNRYLVKVHAMGLTVEELEQAKGGTHVSSDVNKNVQTLMEVNTVLATLAQRKASLLAKREMNAMKG